MNWTIRGSQKLEFVISVFFGEFCQQPNHLVQLPVLLCDLVLEPVEPGPDGHGLDVAPPVHAVVVGARLAQGLVQSPLQLLDPHHHVQVALRVLLYHIPYVVRLSSLKNIRRDQYISNSIKKIYPKNQF